MRGALVIAHRWFGLSLAVFLTISGLTGALIAWDHELDAWLASEAAYAAENAPSLGDKTRERGEIAAKVDALEEEWMEKQEAMQWVR